MWFQINCILIATNHKQIITSTTNQDVVVAVTENKVITTHTVQDFAVVAFKASQHIFAISSNQIPVDIVIGDQAIEARFITIHRIQRRIDRAVIQIQEIAVECGLFLELHIFNRCAGVSAKLIHNGRDSVRDRQIDILEINFCNQVVTNRCAVRANLCDILMREIEFCNDVRASDIGMQFVKITNAINDILLMDHDLGHTMLVSGRVIDHVRNRMIGIGVKHAESRQRAVNDDFNRIANQYAIRHNNVQCLINAKRHRFALVSAVKAVNFACS
ncbi:hypothetical protein B9Z52_10750 [Limnohabitans sp. Jir72]|nr:hypothetical protein B9Z52_10750 [Limnohabitans sp. Jir72]